MVWLAAAMRGITFVYSNTLYVHVQLLAFVRREVRTFLCAAVRWDVV